MKQLRSSIVGLSLLALMGGCGSASPPSPTAKQDAPFKVVTVAVAKTGDERWVDGRVEGVDQATIAAQTSGEVMAIAKDSGDQVGAGDIVLRLRGTQQRSGLQQAEAALRAAEAREVEVQTRFSRMSSLFERKAISKAAFDEALAQREAAVSQSLAARAAVLAARETVSYTTAAAPFSGVVTDRYVRVGSVVSPGVPLFAVSATERLRVVTDVPEEFASAIRARGEVLIQHGSERIAGRSILVQPRTGEGTGAVGLRVDLPSAIKDLQPGMIVKLAIVTGLTERITVPVASVATRGEVTGVYVFDPSSGRVTFRQLRLGRVVADQVDVLAGLVGGEQIATDPAVAMRHMTQHREQQ
jgi:RND family efflux transporter MFP subunit